MATNTTGTRQATSGTKVAAALAQDAGARRMAIPPAGGSAESPDDAGNKPSGYGLPCAKCRLYYPANLDICPTCHHHERVSPVVPKVPNKVKQAAPEPSPDSAAVEQEREEFLRQFKSQLLEANAGVANSAGTTCTMAE